ncbi:tectonic-2-like [Anneissia japonica]|uniref:tectonic-2-like n=1 Tax=Anneissia japonica TaxID=1529436 RepID=UPI0014256868|nr:tectonic-2-like [Anneissia japonica]
MENSSVLRRFSHRILIFLCSLNFIVNTFTQSEDLVGVVNVGTDAVINDTNIDLFTVSINEQYGELPITLAVYNITSKAFVPNDIIQDQDITVYCEVVTPYTEGDTTVQFVPKVLPNIKQTFIKFDIGNQGRAVEVRCQGSSITEGSLFQNSTEGSTGFVAVVKSPVVSICQEMVVVPYLLDETYTQEITLQLSEEVAGSDVNITCDVDPDYQGDDFLSLEFTDETAPIGATEISVSGFHHNACQSSQWFKKPILISDPPCVNSTCVITTTTPAAITQPSSTQDTTTTPAAITQPSSTQDTPLEGDSNWILVESVIVFDSGDLFKKVEAVYNNIGEAYQGLLVLTCCASADFNQNTQYMNQSAALLMVVDVSEDREIIWDFAADSSNLTDESELPNPAYVEIGPCNCDLTADHCDPLCCCDMDCTEDDLALFPCLPGIPGGDFTEEWEYSCENTDIFRPDWFPFLCVETVNKLFLGYYFSSVSGATDNQGFESLQSALPTNYTTFEESEDRALDTSQFSSSQGYQYGAPLQLIYENNIIGLLALPQQGASGSCLWTSAVKYQVDSNSTCVMNITQQTCSSSSALNASLFVQSSDTTYPPCPDPPEVISAFGYVTDRVAVSQIEYFCLDDLSGYLQSNETASVYGLYTKSLPYVGGKQQVPYSRCVWDDDFTRPPDPSYSNTTQTCDHSVVEVQYEIVWQGGEVLILKGAVFLGSVPIQSSGIMLNPKYSVKFSHQLPITNNDETGAVEIPEEVFKRSGNPGYQVGELLLSGTTVYEQVNVSTPNPACNDSTLNSTECDPTTGEMLFSYIDTSLNSRLKYIASGSSGLCEDSAYEDITFGEDLMSGCIYRVGLSELDNCTILRQELETQLRALMQADRIAKIGNASSYNDDDWITIFREPIEYEVVSTVEPYQERVNDVLAELIGTCYHMPVSVHLHIMYADAGMSKGLILQEVVAAKISYQTKTLQLNCAGGNSASCQQNATVIGSERVQQFVLNNWVTFTKVPAIEPERVINYFKDVDESLCKQDKCPEEAFYPLTRAFMGDSFEYSLGLWLTLMLFGLGYVMVTKPWC